jgi:hypothetical protein
MFDDDECEHDEEYAGAGKFSLWDLAVAFFAFIHGIGRAVENAAEIMLKSSMAASNRDFHLSEAFDQAHMELESLPVTEGEDG